MAVAVFIPHCIRDIRDDIIVYIVIFIDIMTSNGVLCVGIIIIDQYDMWPGDIDIYSDVYSIGSIVMMIHPGNLLLLLILILLL